MTKSSLPATTSSAPYFISLSTGFMEASFIFELAVFSSLLGPSAAFVMLAYFFIVSITLLISSGKFSSSFSGIETYKFSLLLVNKT